MITEVQMLIQKLDGHRLPDTGYAMATREGDVYIPREKWSEIKKDMELYKEELEKKGG